MVTEIDYFIPSTLPRELRKAELYKEASPNPGEFDSFLDVEESVKQGTSVYKNQPPVLVMNEEDANIVTSKLPWKGPDGEDMHSPLLDLDFSHDYSREDGVGVLLCDISIPSSAVYLQNSLRNFGLEFEKDAVLITVPHFYLPSSTKGHGHLYLETIIPAPDFWILLDYLRSICFLEGGYVKASKYRGYSSLRVPWVKKSPEEMKKKSQYEDETVLEEESVDVSQKSPTGQMSSFPISFKEDFKDNEDDYETLQKFPHWTAPVSIPSFPLNQEATDFINKLLVSSFGGSL